jgi:hypothetical protein
MPGLAPLFRVRSPTVVQPVIVTSCAKRGDEVEVAGLVLSARKMSAEKMDSGARRESGRDGFCFVSLLCCRESGGARVLVRVN